MITIKETPHKIITTKTDVVNIFGHLFVDFDGITLDEFSACINYAHSQGWSNWMTAFENWKSLGHIPIEDAEEE